MPIYSHLQGAYTPFCFLPKILRFVPRRISMCQFPFCSCVGARLCISRTAVSPNRPVVQSSMIDERIRRTVSSQLASGYRSSPTNSYPSAILPIRNTIKSALRFNADARRELSATQRLSYIAAQYAIKMLICAHLISVILLK